MDEIMWHRRESRRKTEKTNFVLQLRKAPIYSNAIETFDPKLTGEVSSLECLS